MATQRNTAPALTYKDIFNTDSIEEARAHIEEMTERYVRMSRNFKRSYQGKLYALSPERMRNAIERFHELEDIKGYISNRISLAYSLDHANVDIKEIHDKGYAEIVKGLKQTEFFYGEIGLLQKQHPKAYKKFRGSRALIKQHQRFLLDTQYSPSKDSLDAGIEKALGEVEPAIEHMKTIYDDMMAVAMFTVDGEEMNYTSLQHILNSSPDVDKKAAALAAREEFFSRPHMNSVVTSLCNAVIKLNHSQRRISESPYADSSHHEANQVDRSNVTKMLAAMDQSDAGYRYFKLKAKQCGKSKLDYADMWGPVPGTANTRISWKEAQDIVVSAFTEFSPRMGEKAQAMFDNHWIDARPRPGKESGGLCYSSGAKDHPWVTINYHGSMVDLMYLAHEVGHAVGYMMTNEEQGNFQNEPTTLIAETAASMGEEITFDELEKRLTAKNDIKGLAELQAERIENTLDMLLRGYDYKVSRECHTMVRQEDGATLGADVISDKWRESRRSFLGPKTESGELDTRKEVISFKGVTSSGWAGSSYFFSDPFYLADYAMTKLITLGAIAASDAGKVNDFPERFEKFLGKGCTQTTPKLIQGLGVDIDHRDFWKQGMAKVGKMVDRYEELIEQQQQEGFGTKVSRTDNKSAQSRGK